MFKRLQFWFLRPVLEELWDFHQQIQVMRLMAFARHQELENIIDNLTGKHTDCLQCSKLQEQLDRYAQLFGERMDEVTGDSPSS